jgi:hypothetical protein
MTRADHLVHGEIAEPQPSPGFLLAPFGWAAEPVAAMMRADRSLFECKSDCHFEKLNDQFCPGHVCSISRYSSLAGRQEPKPALALPRFHSITSSARPSSVSGKVMPSALGSLEINDQLDLRDSHPCALTQRQLQLLEPR